MKLVCSQPDGKGSPNLTSSAACNMWTMPHKTQVVTIAMQHPFNRTTRLLPSDLSIFYSPVDKTGPQFQKRSPLLVHKGAQEMPIPRLGARLIRTNVCCVIPDHAHFNVRPSGGSCSSPPKQDLKREFGVQLIKYRRPLDAPAVIYPKFGGQFFTLRTLPYISFVYVLRKTTHVREFWRMRRQCVPGSPFPPPTPRKRVLVRG